MKYIAVFVNDRWTLAGEHIILTKEEVGELAKILNELPEMEKQYQARVIALEGDNGRQFKTIQDYQNKCIADEVTYKKLQEENTRLAHEKTLLTIELDGYEASYASAKRVIDSLDTEAKINHEKRTELVARIKDLESENSRQLKTIQDLYAKLNPGEVFKLKAYDDEGLDLKLNMRAYDDEGKRVDIQVDTLRSITPAELNEYITLKRLCLAYRYMHKVCGFDVRLSSATEECFNQLLLFIDKLS